MKVTAQLYGQFLVSSQVNYTGTYLADHLDGLTHDNVGYFLKTSYFTPRQLWQQVRPGQTLWANYLKDVVAQFQQRGVVVSGFDCMFGGNIPMGAGLSSSTAVECGLAFALDHLLHTNLSRLELARISQRAEHEFAGMQCGIMD